ncbi:MAG: response regulator transcription factor [Caldilineaceae bacterium]
MADKIRVLVADDHAIVRHGLTTLINSQPDMAVVDEAQDGMEAVLKQRAHHPDVILMDLVMPRLDGLAAIQQIKAENVGAHILVLTSFAEDDKVFPAIKAGALGYLLKDSSPGQLLQAIRDVHQGKSSLDPTIALKLIQELNRPSEQPLLPDPLSEREVAVLKLVARGLSNQDIADQLIIGERTVGSHISNILSKLHLANRTQAALYALREGLATLE